jgi:4'-phosphopantetheinyl transferase
MSAVIAIARLASDVAVRHPKAQQRALADAAEVAARSALEAQGIPRAYVSRSHSRGMAAAAAVPAGPAGIDIEFMDSRRPWLALFQHLLGCEPGPAKTEDFARAWTFIEAWYKAFGAWPAPALVLATLRNPAPQTFLSPCGEAFWTARVVGEFALSLVSRSPEPPTLLLLPASP